MFPTKTKIRKKIVHDQVWEVFSKARMFMDGEKLE